MKNTLPQWRMVHCLDGNIKLHPNGELEREGVGRIGNEVIIGAYEYDKYGNEIAMHPFEDIFNDPCSIPWKKNGKQSVFLFMCETSRDGYSSYLVWTCDHQVT